MSDDTRTPRAAETTEPPSSTAPASRGPSLWQRLRALFALRTVSLRDDLEVALENESSNPETSDFSESERTILQNVLALGDKRVDDVMVERTDIIAVEAQESLGTMVARFREFGHSRLPVYDDNLDNILGFVHVKDALRRITEPVPAADGNHQPVKLVSQPLRAKAGKLDFMRTVLFVPPSMPVGDLLQSMQSARVHMAIVVDEYGGTDGLVTIEDLLEAVVGEIEDEHDESETAMVRQIDPNTYVANGRAELDEVREVVGPDFDPGVHGEDVDTLAGLVFDLAGRMPVKGEIVTGLKGFEFEVLLADPRQVKRLKIKRLARPARTRAKRDGAAHDAELATDPAADQQKSAAE
jgi:CBS domain containing-hemolysin-like protein